MVLSGMEKIRKLRWINQEPNILSAFLTFWQQKLFTDCTIICRGKHFHLHRLVLASCSDYFKDVFDNTECSHPIIIMNDISFEDLEILLNYMYEGKSVIPLEKLSVVIKEGQALKIKGFDIPTQLVSTTSKTSSVTSSPNVAITDFADFELSSPVPQVKKYPVVVLVRLDNTFRSSTPKWEDSNEFKQPLKKIKFEDVKQTGVKIIEDFNYEDRNKIKPEFHSNESESNYFSDPAPELKPNLNGMDYSQDLVLQLKEDSEVFQFHETVDDACPSNKAVKSSTSVSEQSLEQVCGSSQTWFNSPPRSIGEPPLLQVCLKEQVSSPQGNEGIVISHSSQSSCDKYENGMTSVEKTNAGMVTYPLELNDIDLANFEDADTKNVSSNISNEFLNLFGCEEQELSTDISGIKSDSPSFSEDSKECSKISSKENTNGVLQSVTPNFKNHQRPCPFCLKTQSKLTRHIKTRHRNEPAVTIALKKSKEECNEAFRKMRKCGILKANERSLKTGSNVFYSEKKKRKEGELVKCSNCLGFYMKRAFRTHRVYCATTGKVYRPIIPIPATASSDYVKDSFNFEVKSRFRDDSVGQLIKSNDHIMSYVKERYAMIENMKFKKAEAITKIICDVRKIGDIAHRFLQKTKVNGKICSLEDMFLLENFDTLIEAVQELSDGKKSQRLTYGYAIKKLASHVIRNIISLNDPERLKQLGNFIKKFKSKWANYFTEYEKIHKGISRTEKQASLPSLKDITSLRNYIIGRLQEMDAIPSSQWDYQTYIEARRVSLCRLIFLNSHHSGKSCKLTVDEWQEALADKWIDREYVESLDEGLKEIFHSFKIAFQPHNRQPFIPTFIPKDCIPILAKLADQQMRKHIGKVNASNIFLFANSHGSESHSNWSSDISLTCFKAKTFLGISTLKIHRRTSSKFISLDIPEKLREVFFQHTMICRKKSLQRYKCSLVNEASTLSGTLDSQLKLEIDSLDASAASVDHIEDHNGSMCADTIDSLGPISLSIKRSYHKWSKQQEQVIQNYFRSYIEDVKESRGVLPSREAIKTFLEINKLFEASEKEKTSRPLDPIALIKTKVFNERTKWRRNQCRLNVNNTSEEGSISNQEEH